MDIKEKIESLINHNNIAEDVAFDEEYQSLFEGEGARKSKYILDLLSTNSEAIEEDLSKYVFVSIGGADGSEAEEILRNTGTTRAILLEISDAACKKARRRGVTIQQELNKELLVVQGDVTQRIPDILRHMEKYKREDEMVGMMLSAQAVIHELPRRSPGFRCSVFFGQLFNVFENNMFFGQEPIKTERWPDIVELKVGNATSERLARLAAIINDRLSITELNATPVANGFINIDATLALELLHKLIRSNTVSEFVYELREQLTSVNPDAIKKTIESHLGSATTTIEPITTNGFIDAWKKHAVVVKDEEGGALSFPITHARIVAISTAGSKLSAVQKEGIRRNGDIKKENRERSGLSNKSINLRRLLQSKEWIVGAVNFDEDLHFSSFYLRASCKKYISRENAEYGYSSLIAVYDNFNETYYIPRSECISVAEALLNRIKGDPLWLQQILDEIEVRAKELGDVFPYERDSNPFRGQDLDELITNYSRHNSAHRSLYAVARIPEALDRGVGVFNGYLKNYLRDHMGSTGKNRKSVNENFRSLTFPEKASYVHIELEEFHQILHEIQQAGQKSAFSGSSKRAILKLDPKLRMQLDRHRDKWSFWGYHGYGSRALLDISYYLQRISSEFTHSTAEDPGRYAEVLERAEQKRLRLIDGLNIDSDHSLLFRLYSRIGITKLYRRYYQLRNFYFLDQLLDEFARALGVPEGLVRSLLPNELEAILSNEITLGDQYRERIDNLVYVIDGDKENVFSGSTKYMLVSGLLAKSDQARIKVGDKLQGTPISGGIARGRCKKVIRKEDAAHVDFRPGDILVSESTDMDLYEVISEAAGVVTESGGVSCHAAIVCRELNKPALVGVKNALSILQNNDLIVLDADEGFLTTDRSIQREFTVEDIAATDLNSSECGNKAKVLSRLLRAAIFVPRFFVVPLINLTKTYFSKATDADGSVLHAFSSEVADALKYLNGEMFVIRSSMADEDTSLDFHGPGFA